MEAVLNHEKPDRVPIDFLGNASMMLDETYHRVRKYLGLSPIEPVREGHTANYYDERILEFLNIDFRRLFLPKRGSLTWDNEEKQTFTDEWGIQYQKTGNLVNILDSPLKGVDSVSELEKYEWPDPQEVFTTEGLESQAKDKFKNTDWAIVARNPLSKGFLDQSCALMGISEFFECLIKKPTIAHRIIEKLLDIYTEVYSMFLSPVADYIQIVETADDLGAKENLLISPTLYRKFIKPADLELNRVIHEVAPGAKLFKHSDGAIFQIIPDLIGTGVDILNPIQTSCEGMNADKLQNEFGDSIVFHGSVEKVGSSAEELMNEVKYKIDTLGSDGGYIFSVFNHVIDASPEQVVAMFQKARRFGVYDS